MRTFWIHEAYEMYATDGVYSINNGSNCSIFRLTDNCEFLSAYQNVFWCRQEGEGEVQVFSTREETKNDTGYR